MSPLDIPPWTNSAMDGYAARGADVRGASPERPVRLRVVETSAGRPRSRRGAIGPGECARIFTGRRGPGRRRHGHPAGGHRPRRGHGHHHPGPRRRRQRPPAPARTSREGTTVLRAGTELGPAALGVLASLAVAHPLVHRRPRVAILGSGDEIVDVDQPEEILSGRKTASSNTHTLRRAGPSGGRGAGQSGHRPRLAGEPAIEARGTRSTPICCSPRPASASASTTICARC